MSMPRGLVILASIWFFGSWVLCIGLRPPVHPSLASYAPGVRLLLACVAVGLCAGWPLLRLSGPRERWPVFRVVMDLAVLLALFHVAKLLVTNDGGPGQFAALTPIWTVMLFGPETPALYAPLTPQCHSFYSQWPCSPCLTAYNHRNSFCDGDNQCLKVIAPDAVLEKAREFLAAA